MTRRDEKTQKFVRANGRYRAKRTRSGRSGPSRYARLSALQLAEHLVDLEDEHDSRLAELGEYDQARCSRRPPPQVIAMLNEKRARMASEAGVLAEIVDRLVVERCTTEFSRPELAELMAEQLGHPVSVRKLYRPPYVSVIEGTDEDFGAARAYDSRGERVRRHARESRGLLIHYSLRLEKLIATLQERCSLRLIEEAPDLTPLIPPHSS